MATIFRTSGQVSFNNNFSLLSNKWPQFPSHFWICCCMLNKVCHPMVTFVVLRWYIFQKLLPSWNFSCINKKWFFIKKTDTYGHIVVCLIYTSHIDNFMPQHTAFEQSAACLSVYLELIPGLIPFAILWHAEPVEVEEWAPLTIVVHIRDSPELPGILRNSPVTALTTLYPIFESPWSLETHPTRSAIVANGRVHVKVSELTLILLLEKTICMNINYNCLTTIFRGILTQL